MRNNELYGCWIGHRMPSLWMLNAVALTFIFKVKHFCQAVAVKKKRRQRLFLTDLPRLARPSQRSCSCFSLNVDRCLDQVISWHFQWFSRVRRYTESYSGTSRQTSCRSNRSADRRRDRQTTIARPMCRSTDGPKCRPVRLVDRLTDRTTDEQTYRPPAMPYATSRTTD